MSINKSYELIDLLILIVVSCDVEEFGAAMCESSCKVNQIDLVLTKIIIFNKTYTPSVISNLWYSKPQSLQVYIYMFAYIHGKHIKVILMKKQQCMHHLLGSCNKVLKILITILFIFLNPIFGLSLPRLAEILAYMVLNISLSTEQI